MSIHPNFADWYRSATITVPEGLLQKRWAAVEAIAKKPNADLIIKLAKLFTLPSATESAVPEGFREAFRAQDETFSSRDNIQELRVLAGAVLRLIINEEGHLAALASLALACGSFGPRGVTLSEHEHLDAAERYLLAHAKKIRECTAPSVVKVPNLTKTRISELFPQTAFANIQTLQEPLVSTLTEIGSGVLNALKAIEALSHTVEVREEELNILWWLQAGFSRELQKTFIETGYETGALIFPVELAELTSFVPGPESATAVLVHALQVAGVPSSSATITLAKAINATPREWREKLCAKLDLSSVGLLCPVLLGVQKSLETDGTDEWLPVYRKACDVPIDKQFSLLEIAVQTYRERLLNSLLAEKS